MGDLSRINTNVAALRSFLTLTEINERILVAQERIATGRIVNRASDSPANYFISQTLQIGIQALQAKVRAVERGINFLETQDTSLAQVANILLQMNSLVNQAKSDAVTSAEKQAIALELSQLSAEITTIGNSGVSPTLYSGFTIGDLEGAQVSGALSGANGARPNAANLNVAAGDLIVTGTAAQITEALSNISTALDIVLKQEEQIGAYISRLRVQTDRSNAEIVDQQSSLSSVQDADLAQEQIDLTKLQILQQTALAMLSQANVAPQSILVLLGFGG